MRSIIAEIGVCVNHVGHCRSRPAAFAPWICDRIGGRRTLLLGSGLQAAVLVLFLPFDGLASLYVVSALFGLAQGGIVPAYAVIVREFFPPEEAGVRVSAVLMATVFGMALGGWVSGVTFDLTGSYQVAFVNGILWNLLNLAIAVALLRRPGTPAAQGYGLDYPDNTRTEETP